jgi:hypothetical protein
MLLSGPQWVSQFPTSNSLDDLSEPFRSRVKRFVAALRAARGVVSINDTLRRPQRAHLMHFSWAIAREGLNPASVPVLTGVDIQWTHLTPAGLPDFAASKTAAEEMVEGYGIVFRPALTSRHIEGNAIDMDISWLGNLVVARPDGTSVTISSSPRTGMANRDLHQLGALYGVIKLVTDPPHWSVDGH